jgi:5-(carboxyamino)imidazole ribonucleotide mutase
MASPIVGIIMGSTSDMDTMQHAANVLEELGVPHEVLIISAHRTPDRMFQYAAAAKGRGIEVIIAGAGGAAHLPGMTAAKTVLPVIGVPVQSAALNGLDSLLSIVQMPRGVPVATVAIGAAGALNAGLLAAQIVGLKHPDVQARLESRRKAAEREVVAQSDAVASGGGRPGRKA